MPGSAPDVGAIERFRADLTAVIVRASDGAAPTERMTFALAVSGGPDSMAMLALAHAAFPGRIAAATFDHRLREDSADEARMVADACTKLGIPHATLTPDAPIAGSSLQAQAREARYAGLVAWAAGRPLLTAHHADDQAETLLMRLNRASGLSGLAAIRPVRWVDGTPILRPLLGWRRAELRTIAAASGLAFVDDPANADPRHDRTAVRTLLAATAELDPVALAASAGFLAEAEEVVARQVELAWSMWRQGDPLGADDVPRELRRRLVRRAILDTRERLSIVTPAFNASANVERLLDALQRGRAATQGGVKVTPTRAGWTFAPAPARRSH